jgi:DNA mismatch repair ATPase MutS
LTDKTGNAALPLLPHGLGGLMNDLVERILNSYQSMRPLDDELIADSRKKIRRYLENLASAGQRDAKLLTLYGLAYLKELHEGRDPKFTGC